MSVQNLDINTAFKNVVIEPLKETKDSISIAKDTLSDLKIPIDFKDKELISNSHTNTSNIISLIDEAISKIDSCVNDMENAELEALYQMYCDNYSKIIEAQNKMEEFNKDLMKRTYAKDYTEIGIDAYNGDKEAQEEIIKVIAEAARRAYNMSENTKYCPSIMIAQVIQETGWLSFIGLEGNPDPQNAMRPELNNILGANSDLLNDEWVDTTWDGKSVDCSVPQYVNGKIVFGLESMRVFPDMETNLANNAERRCTRNTYDGSIQVKDNLNYKEVAKYTLQGYSTDDSYTNSIIKIIDIYGLHEKYDNEDFLKGKN